MPKSKKRGRGGGRKEKEKPLLTVQGVLRLEKCFEKPQHGDADYITLQNNEKLLLIPGESEHDLVSYKAGYDIGPSNPFPTNEPEAKIYEAQKKISDRQEAFQTMKAESALEKAERERKFKESLGVDPDECYQIKETRVNDNDNDDDDEINNYHPPPPSSFFNDQPLKFRTNEQPIQPPGEEENTRDDETIEEPMVSFSNNEEEKEEEEEEEVSPSLENQIIPSMKDMPQESIKVMALNVAKEMEEKRKNNELEPLPSDTLTASNICNDNDEDEDEGVIYSLDEITRMKEREDEELNEMKGPEINENQIVEAAETREDYNSKILLEQYWEFVRKNPQDFNGWTYLIQHAESMVNAEELLIHVREVYNAFLPLYPYCYAYWIRYSELEKSHDNWQRALAILHRGLEAIPLSVDLWISYLELYHKMYEQHERFDELFQNQCERAIGTVGLEYRSDSLWERYIEWESERKNLKQITKIFRRLIAIPTKLYNKHWDNLIAHIRDHHPRDILEYEEYEELRKITCKELNLTYRPDPLLEPVELRKVTLPEDKLKAGMKERIVAAAISDHEETEREIDNIYRFEEKIKRNYFHIKPLDAKQLKNWDNYLDYQIEQGQHERVVVLFERCLIPCANYEQFWAKYARYLERHAINAPSELRENSSQNKISTLDIEKARWSFGTGLKSVDELRNKRCTWTLKGWKEKDRDGNEVIVAEENITDDQQTPITEKLPTDKLSHDDKEKNDVEHDIDNDVENDIQNEMSTVIKTCWSNESSSNVIQSVYKRACIVHCPKKAMIKLKWAAYEEQVGNLDSAKEILMELNKKFPLLLECCIQLIDIERRLGNFENCESQYKKLMKKIPANRKNIKAWLSIKYSRFMFKVVGQPDKALAILKNALKKERSDVRLYSQIIDICYQRQPVDVKGVTAAIELALVSTELNHRQKFEFVKRKVEFMQEFGDVGRYRDALDQLKKFRASCAQELKLENKKKKELLKEEAKLKELNNLKAQVRAQASMKAKIAEREGRLMCQVCHNSMYPDAKGSYEFERFGEYRPCHSKSSQQKMNVDDDDDNDDDNDDGVIDLMDMMIPEEEEEEIQKSLKEKTKYKEVAPTWELNIETYGYGKKRKTYDPEYEHVENAKFREYERLEAGGYDEEMKDPDHDKLKKLNTPGLGSKNSMSSTNDDNRSMKYTSSDYIVPPKVPQLIMGPGIGPVRPSKGDQAPGSEVENDMTVFELPPEIANPQKSPCVNVPEWFVKEGGELCLSDTKNGISVIRYWPKFLSDKGNHLMFNRLRNTASGTKNKSKLGVNGNMKPVLWHGMALAITFFPD